MDRTVPGLNTVQADPLEREPGQLDVFRVLDEEGMAARIGEAERLDPDVPHSAQLEQRRLENEEALLQLRGQNLLQREALPLLHPLCGHTPSLPASSAAGKRAPPR